MSAAVRILVATGKVEDGRLVRKLLLAEFENVQVSSDPDKAADDFDKCRPAVLILAFDTLEDAERYYLGLYRLGAAVHTLPHRTVILCNKDQVRRAYEQCRKEYYDDYVLFWPMNHDATRLPMAVHHALRRAASEAGGESAARQMAAQVRQLGDLDGLIERHAIDGGRQIEATRQSLERAGQDIGQALDRFSQRMVAGGPGGAAQVRDGAAFSEEIARLKTEEIERRLQRVTASVQPIQRWAGSLRTEIAPQLASVRALKDMSGLVRPVVLVVDDDEFQRKLLGRMLGELDVDVMFAAGAVEALTLMGKRCPDLVLMDIELPDMSGIEATRRLKSVERFADVAVVMITGHSDKGAVLESLKAGSCGFVVKPFERETLLARLRTLLYSDSGI